jgi:isocitrate/isopropylmalate dehydrogenase
MFEPVHSSASKYAGIDRVNPIVTIMASAMILDRLGEKATEKNRKRRHSVLSEWKVRTHNLGGKLKARNNPSDSGKNRLTIFF